MTKSTVLPENVLRCMSAKDRAALGQKTAGEVMAAGEVKLERELQKRIVQLLNLKGIEVNASRTDKRKTDKVGWPDLTFAVHLRVFGAWAENSIPCAWELKRPGEDLSDEQKAIRSKLTTPPNAWRYRVITSVDMAIKELREMGIA